MSAKFVYNEVFSHHIGISLRPQTVASGAEILMIHVVKN